MYYPEDRSKSLGSSPASSDRDYLSDTGVMRILGDYPSPDAPASREETLALRSCPICSRSVPEASTVCRYCLSYLAPSPDYLRSLKQ